MSVSDLKTGPTIREPQEDRAPEPDVGRLHTTHTTRLATELSALMWGADEAGRTTFVSEALLEAVGYDQDELTGEPLSRLLSPENGAGSPPEMVEHLLGGERRIAMTLLTRDNEKYRISWEPMARRDRNGRLIEVIGVAREVLPGPDPGSIRREQLNLFDAARVCVLAMGPDGTIRFVNREAETVLGYQRAELEGRNYFEVLTPREEGVLSWREIRDHVVACLAARDYDGTVVTKDGRRLVMRWSSAPLEPMPEGATDRVPDELLLFGLDVTNRRRQEREEWIRAEIASLGTGALRFDSYFDAVQHHLSQLVGFDSAALLRVNLAADTLEPVLAGGTFDWGRASGAETFGDAVRQALREHEAVACTIPMGGASVDKASCDKTSVKGSCVVVPLVMRGHKLGLFAVGAARPDAFDALATAFLGTVGPSLAAAFGDHLTRIELDELQADHRLVFDRTDEGVLVLDREMRCRAANPAACRILGLLGRKFVGRLGAELLSPGNPDVAQKRLGALDDARICSLGAFTQKRRGAERPVEIEATAAWADDRAVFVMIHDVTERNRLRRENDERKRETQWLARNAGAGIALVRNGRLLGVNTELTTMFAYPSAGELQGLPVGVLFAAGEGERLLGLGEKVAGRIQLTGRRRSGTGFPVEVRTASFMLGENTTLLIIRDLGQRTQLIRTLDRVRRVHSFAQLSAGVAHDFNSLLVTILGGTTLARSLEPGDPRQETLLGKIRDAASRAAELTSRLLSYTQGGRYVIEPVSLSQVVADTLSMLKGCLPRSIRIETELAKELPLVQGDPLQIMQMVLQTVLNAVEAMVEQASADGTSDKGGRLLLITDEFTVAEEIDPDRPDVRPGHYVRLLVSDTGSGMGPEMLRCVCDPYVTTKGPGRGLGMAAAREIVSRSNGFLTLTSSPGEGTDVEVLLPPTELARREKAGT